MVEQLCSPDAVQRNPGYAPVMLFIAQSEDDDRRHAGNHKSDDVFGMQQAVHRCICRMTRVRQCGR